MSAAKVQTTKRVLDAANDLANRVAELVAGPDFSGRDRVAKTLQDYLAAVEEAHAPERPAPRFEEVGEPFWCGRRAESGSRAFGPDRWWKVGPDRCCSYCGSLHPDDLREIAEAYLRGEGGRVEGTDKSYKLYANRAGIRNGGEGGSKFYRAHHPDGEPSAALMELLRRALEKNAADWKARREKIDRDRGI